MDLKKLRTLHLVARFGSLQRAANHLRLTIPAVSLQMKRLESELGLQLFHHRRNKLILTEKGRLFLERARDVIKAVEKAEAMASAGVHAPEKLSISLGGDLAKLFAPQIVSFLKSYPNLRLTLLGRSSSETLSLVRRGEVDIGVGRFERVPREIRREKLFENGIVLAFPKSHHFAKAQKIQLRDISTERLITLMASSATRRSVDQTFMRGGIEIQNIVEVGSCQAALELVQLGLGVGLVHDVCMSAHEHKALGCMNMGEVFAKSSVTLIYRRSTILTRAHTDLIKELSQRAFRSSESLST